MILTALAAACCMVLVDIMATICTQAEAANRGWLAGAMDALGWLPGIVCTTIAVTQLTSPSWSARIWVLALVSVANVFGTKLGQITGKRLLARSARKRLAAAGAVPADLARPRTDTERLEYLERLLGVAK